jgi:hypothetical protein
MKPDVAAVVASEAHSGISIASGLERGDDYGLVERVPDLALTERARLRPDVSLLECFKKPIDLGDSVGHD